MIKVGITGASLPAAGELLRILINHPDVDLRVAHDPDKAGHTVCSVHHGMMGDTSLCFTEQLNPSELDLLVVCKADALTDKIVEEPGLYPELRVIDISGSYRDRRAELQMAYGLSEINRKALVRGAKRAVIPSPVASAALISLYPFAMHLLLNSEIAIDVATDREADIERSKSEISEVLSKVQNSFSSEIALTQRKADFRRGIRMNIRFRCPLTIEDIFKLYDDIYDDHNFTFMTSEKLDIDEVEGTNKCLISLSKPSADTVEIETIADATLRGGAGEAVHVMNLLFGLYEKTGLMLKAVNY